MAKILFLFFTLTCSSLATAAAETILVLGDSLSAGFGIAIEQSWPALLNNRLQENRLPHKVANASISGETTAGGKSRLPALLEQHRPALVILALGANDGLRGLPLASARSNLIQMVRQAKTAGARVLLIGMRLPPNYGPEYTRLFAAMFDDIAKQEKTGLLPFLLEPVALDTNAFLPDRLHPTAAAQPKLLDHVWQALKPLIKQR